MLAVKNLCFDYADNPLLGDVTFTVQAGELLHLRGANGSGKTTLIRLLAGILSPQSGEISYNQKPIHQQLAEYHQHICYVGHKPSISLFLTPKENCEFEFKKKHAADYKKLMDELFLHEVSDLPCGLLSAGQRRKVGLLRLQLTQSKLWLLDEPFVALDQDSIYIIGKWCNEHLLQGGQIVLTSHQDLPFSYSCKEYLL
ncbi:heme exporter protein CcmA (plasmid) [Legionella adelaidensis]|uniref:Heme exporter protein CcmA n=1 Tax=Legionella adelaidensis TaxID=45056 RepID=A0A0W0R4C0_9GAMM|nr:cytochrome c biogenesis heme-transporting ATPase CcmA [Legionella adelaidensis]KTC65912.1 heme exporter protein CcmA [Legionella adelaidensis]VEH85532.1 heme exporter protein CcmA [Legionella adelaidensis]